LSSEFIEEEERGAGEGVEVEAVVEEAVVSLLLLG